MTFAVLRALHAIIGDALDDIERIYAANGGDVPSSTDDFESPLYPGAAFPSVYASPPPSPSVLTGRFPTMSGHRLSKTDRYSAPLLDFPSLDIPCDPKSKAESLTAHPAVLDAINRIVAATGQINATVQPPFLTICDASMGYHLPSCMRLLEASHVVEILREAGPAGLHVDIISVHNGVDSTKLAHSLRLLATHHILLEVSPNVFALNRISSLMDSGKSIPELNEFQKEGKPEHKYRDSNGISAFVGLCTDEIQKASAYMTETYYLSPSKTTREGRDPAKAPFCFAFDTAKSNTGYFGWLEGQIEDETEGVEERVETGMGKLYPAAQENLEAFHPQSSARSGASTPSSYSANSTSRPATPPIQIKAATNRFRLERFGKAMSGTESWETPGAVLHAFDWQSLRPGSKIVDVGGGIGSTVMLLSTAFASSEDGPDLNFVVQDRPVVVEMGEKAWREKSPELLGTSVTFQVHDFFTPQPILDAAVFILRVVLHDWPDHYARKILLRLREAARPDTKLLIADFVLPLACREYLEQDQTLRNVEGARSALVPAPLLPNLGKASANVYWMDMTMQTMFNAQERTLREHIALAASSGWKIVKVSTTPGSHFGHLTAVPIPIPPSAHPIYHSTSSRAATSTRPLQISKKEATHVKRDLKRIERSSSRCGTPTFGSRMRLSSVQEAFAKFGAGIVRSRASRSNNGAGTPASKPVPSLKPAVTLVPTPGSKKPRPSPLTAIFPPSVRASPGSPLDRAMLPVQESQQKPVARLIKKCASLAQLRTRTPSVDGFFEAPHAPPPTPPIAVAVNPIPPTSPRGVRLPKLSLKRRSSHAQLLQTNGDSQKFILAQSPSQSLPSPVEFPTTPFPKPQQSTQGRSNPSTFGRTGMTLAGVRRGSAAQPPQASLRQRMGRQPSYDGAFMMSQVGVSTSRSSPRSDAGYGRSRPRSVSTHVLLGDEGGFRTTLQRPL